MDHVSYTQFSRVFQLILESCKAVLFEGIEEETVWCNLKTYRYLGYYGGAMGLHSGMIFAS